MEELYAKPKKKFEFVRKPVFKLDGKPTPKTIEKKTKLAKFDVLVSNDSTIEKSSKKKEPESPVKVKKKKSKDE